MAQRGSGDGGAVGRGPVPPLLAPRGTDEYAPLPWRPADQQAAARARDMASAAAPADRAAYLRSRRGTAATLRAVDAAHGGGFYAVPEAAEHDDAAADEAFAADGPVIDVQTHLVEPSRWARGGRALEGFLQLVDPDRWGSGVDPRALAAGEWAAQVFGGSETAVALLTALPGAPDHMVLPNADIAAARDLLERYGGSGRVLTHTIVHPNLGPAELERMVGWRDELRPAAWKVYTLWDPPASAGDGRAGTTPVAPGGFFLDDERSGLPFLEHVRDIGPRVVCAHKGLAGPVPDATPAGASPRDVGPAAAQFPDLDLVVYHSGYDLDAHGEEGAYDATGHGVNRLVRSLRESGIGPGANVWAELGSTWFLMLRRPVEAAHVLGKLLLAVGPERILWGTDSIWYGPPQPLIDAFRTFRIPEWMQERFGYPALTPDVTQAILAGNATRLYGLDPAALPPGRPADELAWLDTARAALTEHLG